MVKMVGCNVKLYELEEKEISHAFVISIKREVSVESAIAILFLGVRRANHIEHHTRGCSFEFMDITSSSRKQYIGTWSA